MPDPSLPSPSRLSTWQRWSLGLLALIVLLLLAVWLLLPRWLQASGARLIGEALGREVTLAGVQFQPWRLALVVDGLKIGGATAQAEPLLVVERVDAAVSLRSIWHRSPVLASVTVTRPQLRLTRTADGHYDVDDLIARFSQPGAKPDEPAPALALYNITLTEGQVLLDDRPAGRRHALADLSLHLPFLSTLDADVKVHVEPQLSGRLNGVAFGSHAQALPFADRREATLDFKLAGLDLAPYIAYLPAGLPLRLQRGLVDVQLDLRFSQLTGQAPSLQLSGQLGLRDIALQTPAGAPWLAWRELQVNLKDVQPLRRQVLLGAVSWTGPQLALQRDQQGRLWLPASESTSPAAPARPWTFGLDRFELSDARVDWRDASTRPQAGLTLEDIAVKLGPLAWPLKAAVPLNYGLRAGGATLSGEGSVGPEQLALNWQWQGLTLETLAAYSPVPLRGVLAGRGELTISEPLKADAGQRSKWVLRALNLKKLSAPGLNLAALNLDELALDAGARQLVLGELTLDQPSLQLERTADGRWSYEDLLPPPSPAAEGASAPAWALQLRGLRVDRGSVRLRDALGAALNAEQLSARLQNLAWPATAASLPASLSVKVGAPLARSQGSLQWQGQLGLVPLAASGRLRVERLPLHLLDAYLDPSWGLHLQQADLGLRGEFNVQQRPEGLTAQLGGDLQLADLSLQQSRQIEGRRVVGEDLLSWQALNLDGLKLTLAAGAAPRVQVAEARLNDFYARLIVDEKGKLNLRDLGPREAADKSVDKTATAAPAAPLQLAIAQTRLSNGRVDFTDHFVRPNYSARLSELQGGLGAFASDKPEMAPLSLKGRVAGTGQLEISGQLKPGAPVAMDIKAEASDIELAPLSPYAAKYAGYAIERGKFTTRVQYKVDPGGALQADNQIVLNQLTFGDKVDSPDATTLPVLFAVALLKDRNGVIDVNLPLSGSVNDPEFSVGGLVLKLILNLLGKALTAPFSLFSGGESNDLSQASFVPGSAAPSAPDQLDKLATLLTDRPGLSLTITGWADGVAEKGALQAQQLDAALAAQAPADQTQALKAVYQASKLPTKPRNLLGLAKDLPPEEMRALLLPSYPVSEGSLRQLAQERAISVRDALIAKGIPNSRLFLAAPRLQNGAAGWVPHADLSLGAH